MLYSEKYEEFFGDADWNIEDEIMKTPIATINSFKLILFVFLKYIRNIKHIYCNSPNQTHEFKN